MMKKVIMKFKVIRSRTFIADELKRKHNTYLFEDSCEYISNFNN